MAKYDPLCAHLRQLPRQARQRMSFRQIEDVLGFTLPKSSGTHQAWWANEKDGRHVQANAWLDAGWHTRDLDLKAGQVTFQPVSLPRAPKRAITGGDLVRALTIKEAKQAVARQFGVRPEDVEITVRG